LIGDAAADGYVGRTRIDGLGCGAGLSGAYLGGNVGYASHIVHWEDRDNWWNDGAALPRQSTAWPLQGQGAAGGLQAGYNVQCGHFLLGAETDFQWAGLKSSKTYELANDTTLSAEAKWFGTIRSRVGVLASDQVLLYLAAGAAYADMKWAWSKTTGIPGSFSADRMKWGYTVGGGIDIARWYPVTLRAEVLYIEYPENTVSFTNGSSTYRHDHDEAMWVYRVGVNYSFGQR
jgi:outer membrane immunogenic protein